MKSAFSFLSASRWCAILLLTSLALPVFGQQVPAPAPSAIAPNPDNSQPPPPQLDLTANRLLGRNLGPKTRIKDITTIYGKSGYQVTGLALVTGLAGTGSSSNQTMDYLRRYLQWRGNNLTDIATKSVALVEVTGEVPPNYRDGEKFEVRVAIIDDSTSLRGGEITGPFELTLMNGRPVASVTGSVLAPGFAAQGAAGSVFKNHTTVGVAYAKLQEVINNEPAFPGRHFTLLLRNKDHETAHEIERAINHLFPGTASALDAGAVQVCFPERYLRRKNEFVTVIHRLEIQPDVPARVVIDQRTGTIVMGENVRISPSTFAQSNLVITTSENPIVSQPNAFAPGETTVVPRTQIEAREISSRYLGLPSYPSVGELANALNTLGVPPAEMIGILRGLKLAGHLHAELVLD